MTPRHTDPQGLTRYGRQVVAAEAEQLVGLTRAKKLIPGAA